MPLEVATHLQATRNSTFPTLQGHKRSIQLIDYFLPRPKPGEYTFLLLFSLRSERPTQRNSLLRYDWALWSQIQSLCTSAIAFSDADK